MKAKLLIVLTVIVMLVTSLSQGGWRATPGYALTVPLHSAMKESPPSLPQIQGTSDTTPPELFYGTSPDLNTFGWANGPLTIYFYCFDDESGIRVCPPTFTLEQEASLESIPFTAIDNADNYTVRYLDIGVDMTPPILNMDLIPNVVLLPDNPIITISGSVTDNLSGVQGVSCDNQSAQLDDATFSCDINLIPGENKPVIEARDYAGNVAVLTPAFIIDGERAYSIGTISAEIIEPFTQGPVLGYATLPHDWWGTGTSVPDDDGDGFIALNSDRGTDRGDIPHADNFGAWNFAMTDVVTDGSTALFGKINVTTLATRKHYEVSYLGDVTLREGWMTFEGFDPTLGTLISARLTIQVDADTTLKMSLCDSDFMCDSEGRASASTLASVYLLHDDAYRIWFDEMIPTEIPYETDTECAILTFMQHLNEANQMSSNPWAAVTEAITEALVCLINSDMCVVDPPDWDPDFSETFDAAARLHTGPLSVDLTPEEYGYFLNPDGTFRVYLSVQDTHEFWFEADDTNDSSTYTAPLTFGASIEYFYAPAFCVPGSECYTISGNTERPGVILQAGDDPRLRTVSDANGGYTLQVPEYWSGEVHVWLPGYRIDPASNSYTNVHEDHPDQDYSLQWVPILYAEPNGLTQGYCDSWEDACSLHYALSRMASPGLGQEIWVAGGTHSPGASRFDTFQLVDGVSLYGGFAGDETSRSQRDFIAHPTILSGEIGGESRFDNSFHVVEARDVGPATVIDGFTINGGMADGRYGYGYGTVIPWDFHTDSGGGMMIIGGGPTVRNVVFTGNSATYGGAAAVFNGSPSFEDVIFISNSSGPKGGGLYLLGGSAELMNTSFEDNISENGGGIYANNSSLTISSSMVIDNYASEQGGGVLIEGGNAGLSDVVISGNQADDGAGILAYNAAVFPLPTLTLNNVSFSGNIATGVGGAFSAEWYTLNIVGTSFIQNIAGQGGGIHEQYSDLDMTNSTIVGNQASVNGGGIYDNGGVLDLSYVTFINNSAASEGGAIFRSFEGVLGALPSQINNSILWSNAAQGGTQITNNQGYRLAFAYSDLQGGCPSQSDCTEIISGSPNLGTLRDYGGPTQTIGFLYSSPAMDSIPAGVSGCGTEISLDQRGVSRPQNGACDMGAFEAETGSVMDRPALSAGAGHTCWAVQHGLGAGGLICWGNNDSGQIPPFPLSVPYDQAASGTYHTCALNRDGTVQCWGDNTYGQLNQPGGTFTQISAGFYHTCGLRPDGSAVCWGAGAGSGEPHFGQSSPPIDEHFIQISAGGYHTCGLDLYGSVTCWGMDENEITSPPENSVFTQISAGGFHTCGLLVDGTVGCWGAGEAGESGWFDSGQSIPLEGTFTQVSAGLTHTCGLRPGGNIECWGFDDSGRTDSKIGPFITLSAGGEHNCALRTDQTSILCWGGNQYGQAPQFTLEPSTPPDGFPGLPYDLAFTVSGINYSPALPMACEIIVGSLPPGLSLASGGAISGIPDQPGSYDFTLSCTDANLYNSEQSFTLIINQDADNIPDVIEDGAPNGGDGNNDGTPDSQQANVASLPNAVDESYITIEAAEGSTLTNVSALPLPPDAPPELDYPAGLVTFEVPGLTPGASTSVTLYLPGGQEINTYYKFGPTPDDPTDHWYEFLFDGSTGAVINGNSADGYTIELHFIDGQRGDADLMANGVHNDPGAPAFNPDDTPPLITPLIEGDLGNEGWYVSDVLVSWSVVDEESTVSSQSGCDPTTIDSDTQSITLTCSATSLGGTASESVTLRRDATPPTLNPTVDPNPVTLGQTAVASSGAADNLSGVATESCQIPDTNSVGEKILICTATDGAGNSSSAEITYRVIFEFSGYFSPLGEPGLWFEVRAGSNVPVKFILGGDQGLDLFAPGYPASQPISCDDLSILGDPVEIDHPGNSGLSYANGNAQYHFNWKTEKAWSGTCRQFLLGLVDGEMYVIYFSFR